MSSPTTTGFCVVYRFHVVPGTEDAFRAAWAGLTHAIRDGRGGLGSRLHHVEGDLWLAYAQWPDRATWQTAMDGPSVDPELSAAMGACLTGSLEPILLEPTDDLLVPATIN